jgi:hypothetical protein
MLGSSHLKNTSGREGRLCIYLGKGKVGRFDEMENVHITYNIRCRKLLLLQVRVKKKLHVMAFLRREDETKHVTSAATKVDTLRLGLTPSSPKNRAYSQCSYQGEANGSLSFRYFPRLKVCLRFSSFSVTVWYPNTQCTHACSKGILGKYPHFFLEDLKKKIMRLLFWTEGHIFCSIYASCDMYTGTKLCA